MAIALVQQNTAAANSITLSGVGAGHLLILIANTDASVTSVSDGVNTWIQAVEGVTTGGFNPRAAIWYAKNVASTPGVLTVTQTGGNFPALWLSEWSGADPVTPLESTAHLDNQPSSTVVSPSLTNTNTTDLLITCITPTNTNATVVSSPWVAMPTIFGIIWGAYYLPGSIVTSHAIFDPTDAFCSAGAIFKATPVVTHTVSVSESQSQNESLEKTDEKIISESQSQSESLIKTNAKGISESQSVLESRISTLTKVIQELQILSEVVGLVHILGPFDSQHLGEWVTVKLLPANRWTDF